MVLFNTQRVQFLSSVEPRTRRRGLPISPARKGQSRRSGVDHGGGASVEVLGDADLEERAERHNKADEEGPGELSAIGVVGGSALITMGSAMRGQPDLLRVSGPDSIGALVTGLHSKV